MRVTTPIKCVVCGSTDDDAPACATVSTPFYWRRVNERFRIGLCSRCEGKDSVFFQQEGLLIIAASAADGKLCAAAGCNWRVGRREMFCSWHYDRLPQRYKTNITIAFQSAKRDPSRSSRISAARRAAVKYLKSIEPTQHQEQMQ